MAQKDEMKTSVNQSFLKALRTPVKPSPLPLLNIWTLIHALHYLNEMVVRQHNFRRKAELCVNLAPTIPACSPLAVWKIDSVASRRPIKEPAM